MKGREEMKELRLERKKGKYINTKLYIPVYIHICVKVVQHECNDITESNMVGL